MRFMNKVSDGDVKIENSQQPISAWNEFVAESGETEAAAVPKATTSNQENDWVKDFADHKAKQGIL